MTDFEAYDTDYVARVEASFAKQKALSTIGASLTRIEPGLVEVEVPYDERFTQQHGFIHAGISTTAMDTACGYAAYSLMPPDAGVLTVEMKANLLAPAKGQLFRFVGVVIKPGRTISFCEGKAFAIDDGVEKQIASLSATMMTVTGRSDVKG